ncbi:MAG: exodeoxyribonuclease VII large subunit [Candidatus Aenigmatarchaeota archaeon]
MKDKRLYKISLLISLAGLTVLLVWASLIEPDKVGIQSITREDIGQEVVVEGSIETMDWLEEGHLFFHVKDRKDRIMVVLFKDDAEGMGINRNSLEVEERVEVTGEVKDYNGQLEIIPSRIEKLE